MDISATDLDISSTEMSITSSRFYLRPGILYARTNSSNGYARAVNATYGLLEKVGCWVGGIGPVLWWTNTKRKLTFYNGILVDDAGTYEDDDYNEGQQGG